MSSPKVFLEELQARRSELTEQLRLMENHQADPQRSPHFGTSKDSKPTTELSITRAKELIAELDELIAKIGMPPAA